MKSTYPYKPYYKTLGILTLVIGITVSLLKFFVVGSFAFSFFLVLIGFLQIKQYSKPYLIIEENVLIVQTNTLKQERFLLEDIKGIERKKKKFFIVLENGRKHPIFLNFLQKEDKNKLIEELPAWIESLKIDFSDHLIE